jgi:hypothetical protein
LTHPRVVVAALAAVLTTHAAAAPVASPPLIAAVSSSPRFFNPSLRQQAAVRFMLAAPARVAVAILDRDRFAVRHFAAAPMAAGEAVIRWDGTDDAGATLPNEAYTVRIEAAGAAGDARDARSVVYDPSEHFAPIVEQPAIRSYWRARRVSTCRPARPAAIRAPARSTVPSSRPSSTASRASPAR